MDASATVIPPSEPPDSSGAWYTPDVRAQYEPHPGVIVTITDDEGEFQYSVREPPLSVRDRRAHETATGYFDAGTHTPPRTREGTRERAAEGLPSKHQAVLARLTDRPAGGTRRLAYYVLRDQCCLGEMRSSRSHSMCAWCPPTHGPRSVVHTDADHTDAESSSPWWGSWRVGFRRVWV